MIKSKLNNLINYAKIMIVIIRVCDNFLNIFLCKILNKNIYSINMRGGIKFIINGQLGKADLSMLAEIWHNKYYNPINFEISTKDIVFDIGANNGFFTIFAALQAQKVYAFEPLNKLFDKIQKTIEINGIKNITLENLGLAKEKGYFSFYESHIHNGCHSLYKRNIGDTEIKIPVISLEGYCLEKGISRIDFLKLDCEGAEYQILENMSEKFLRHNIHKISMEYHDDIVPNKTHKILIDLLSKNNYKVLVNNGFLYAINQN